MVTEMVAKLVTKFISDKRPRNFPEPRIWWCVIKYKFNNKAYKRPKW